MGDRGQVKVNSVYLYTHWEATNLVENVKRALDNGRDRWTDHEYLARIIFESMIDGDRGDTTGYGIGPTKHGDIWRLITITEPTNIKIEDNGNTTFEGTFDKLLNPAARSMKTNRPRLIRTTPTEKEWKI